MSARNKKKRARAGQAAPAEIEGARFYLHSKEPLLWWFFTSALCLVCARLSLWAVFEADLFHQLRAGADILSNAHVYSVEEWSHTAKGSKAFNFEWLSNVVVRLIYEASGFKGLSYLRSALVALWLMLYAGLLRRMSGRGPAVWLMALSLPVLAYAMVFFRFQMRPDLFASVIFLLLLHVWITPDLSLRRLSVISISGLLLWANFHAGTVPIGIACFTLMILFGARDESKMVRALTVGAASVTWFLTPQGWNVVRVIIDAVFFYDYTATGNPDHQPFSMRLFETSYGGISFLCWLPYIFAGLIALWWAGRRYRDLPSSFYFRTAGSFVAANLFLLLSTLQKIRVVHYQVAFAAPVIALFLARSFSLESRRLAKGGSWRFLCFALPALSVYLIWWQTTHQTRVPSPGLSVIEVPVDSTAFLAKVKPQREILNHYDFGGYLILQLPDYPVSIDSRELPYLSFMQEENLASQGPQSMKDFLRKYGINAILTKLPVSSYDPQRGFVELPALPLDNQEWALVFIDNVAAVYLRRIAEHQELINQYEYRQLRPGLPASYWAYAKEISSEVRRAARSELERCLQQTASNVYCLTAEAAFYSVQGDPATAEALLLRAYGLKPRAPEILMQLQGFYESQGKGADAARFRGLFKRVSFDVQD